MQSKREDFLAQTVAATRTLLVARGWTQMQLAEALSVDQPWVSNLVRGALTQVNDRVLAAHNYVTNALGSDDIPPSVTDAVRGYIAVGGDPALLAEWIWSLANLRPLKRQGSQRTRSRQEVQISSVGTG